MAQEVPLQALDSNAVFKLAKDKCPAFKKSVPQSSETRDNRSAQEEQEEKCPYQSVLKDKENMQVLEKCPAFRSKENVQGSLSCPFKECESVTQVWSKFANLPPSHIPRESSGEQEEQEEQKHAHSPKAEEIVKQVLANVHSLTVKKQEQLGSCPEFSETCPFKAMDESSEMGLSSLVFGIRTGAQQQQQRKSISPSNMMPLSKFLKEKTKKVHREAENVQFVKDFLKGKVGAPLYKELLARLYHVYSTLESEWDLLCEDKLNESRDLAALRVLWFPKSLNRTKAIEEDLEFFFGKEWKSHPSITQQSPATLAYTGQIKQIAAESPLLLIAHAYTRYLGDLSGGQILMKVARRAMQLPESGEGTAFYVFPDIHKAKDFKNMYRKLLDSIDVAQEDLERLAEESISAFRCNIGLFLEMDELMGVKVTPQDESKEEKKAPGCPFARLSALASAPPEHPLATKSTHHTTFLNPALVFLVLMIAVMIGYVYK